MTMTVTRPLATLLVGAALALLRPTASEACCPAYPPDTHVEIADQEILIVWDPVTRTQHFVRDAQFAASGLRRTGTGTGPAPSPAEPTASADGFGFLVPTPTRPEVAESDSRVFRALREHIRPRTVLREQWRATPSALVLFPLLFFVRTRSGVGDPSAAHEAMVAARYEVEVLERKRVAGYDVAVLAASDARALTAWLGRNGYDARPALRAWAEPYVAKGWIITAFRFAAEPGSVGTGAVRMTFQTDQPLFPFRVPEDQIAPPGQGNDLRAFVVGPGRAAGTLGEGTTARPWPDATVKHARPLAGAALERLIGPALPAGALAPLGESAWLTAFVDPTWPSGTDDLTFAFDPDAPVHEEVIERDVDVEIPIPLDALAVLGVVGFRVARRRRRGARAAKTG